MNLREFDITSRYPAKLASSPRITPTDCEAEVRHLVLQLPEGAPNYLDGQSIGVLAPGPHAFGNPYHLRLYSIASPLRRRRPVRHYALDLCAALLLYIDDVSGERYLGKASNYLCDAKPGDTIPITSPYGIPFHIPTDESCRLLMVGAGTGVAPFRAFVKHIYPPVLRRQNWAWSCST